jgi:hypothetical protein
MVREQLLVLSRFVNNREDAPDGAGKRVIRTGSVADLNTHKSARYLLLTAKL